MQSGFFSLRAPPILELRIINLLLIQNMAIVFPGPVVTHESADSGATVAPVVCELEIYILIHVGRLVARRLVENVQHAGLLVQQWRCLPLAATLLQFTKIECRPLYDCLDQGFPLILLVLRLLEVVFGCFDEVFEDILLLHVL